FRAWSLDAGDGLFFAYPRLAGFATSSTIPFTADLVASFTDSLTARFTATLTVCSICWLPIFPLPFLWRTALTTCFTTGSNGRFLLTILAIFLAVLPIGILAIFLASADLARFDAAQSCS